MSSLEIASQFVSGQRVRIRPVEPVGHCRTPGYIRGATGVVERELGAFRNPEDLAYGGTGLPPSKLYWIRLNLIELFAAYAGAPSDTLLVEVYEHWLAPVATEDGSHVS